MSQINEIPVGEKILPIIVGKDLSNKDVIVDLFRLPHLLISGNSGQGKTVCLNSIITSVLCKKDPSEIKFVFIDTKTVDLSKYSQLNKCFIAQLEGEEETVITDCYTAKRTIDSLNQEKDDRYSLLKKANARSIVEYNDKYSKGLISSDEGYSPMPYIIIAIDEFADLMCAYEEEEFERSLFRIAALGHPVGIHLVLTTMRPSEYVLTASLRPNFPARVAFRMNRDASIRVIDCEDAAYLNSRGDMLLSYSNSVNHLKIAFIDPHEIELIIKYLNNLHPYSKPYILP